MEAVGWPPSAVLRFVSLRGNGEEQKKTAEGGHPTLRAEREALSLIHFLRDHDQPQFRQRALQFAREWK